MSKGLEKYHSKIGSRIGKLVLVDVYLVGNKTLSKWQCDCGKFTEQMPITVFRLNTKSCGCGKVHDGKKTHGLTGSPEYKVWKGMRKRCLGKDVKSNQWYKDRGITICERWLKFENFLKDMGPRPEHYSIERIDNSKGYFPENCQWIPMGHQKMNTRSSRLSPEIVQNFKKRFSEGISPKTMAAEFGMSAGYIGRCISGQKWKHVA